MTVIAVAMAAVATFLSLYNDLVYSPRSECERGGELITVAKSDGVVVFDDISARLIDAINHRVSSLDAIAGTMYRDQAVALGTLLAFALVVWLRSEFFGPAVSPGAVAGLVAIGIAVLVFAASLGPARRARTIQTAAVLRDE